MSSHVLISTLDSELARFLARGLLDSGCEVLGFGMRENTLGALKSLPGFRFQKVDLTRQSVVRSWLYGVTDVLIMDEGDGLLPRMDRLYEALIHLKSRIPRVLYLSNFRVFPENGSYAEKFPVPQHEGMIPEAAAEIMVANYQNHMDAPAAILRTARILGPKFSGDQDLGIFLKSLKKLKQVDLGLSAGRQIQFTAQDEILEAVKILLGSEWRGLETFHCVSYSRTLKDALRQFLKILNPQCRILEHETLASRMIRKTGELSSTARRFMVQKNLLPDYEWLEGPLLESGDSNRLFRFKEPDLKQIFLGPGRV